MNVKVEKKALIITNPNDVTKMEFSFSEDWTDYSKSVYFNHSSTATEMTENAVTIPEGAECVNVIGTKDSSTIKSDYLSFQINENEVIVMDNLRDMIIGDIK